MLKPREHLFPTKRQQKNMKIAIIGTGGVGGYFGGKMAHAGFDVTFFARGQHLKAIQQNGLTVKSFQGNFNVHPAKATDQIEQIGKVDLVILGVKAWQVKEIATTLTPLLHADTAVMPLQNGVMAAEELQAVIAKQNVIGGLCRIFAKIESPGVINHFGYDPSIVFGELNNEKSKRIEQIKSLFEASGINAPIADDITVELWRKFIGICVGGLLAVTRSNYGIMRELPQTRKLMSDLLIEIYQLSQKMGVNVESDFPDKTLAAIDSYPADSNTSLARDVWEGKPSEIEYQNGTVVKLGERYGMETPVNKFIYDCILPMELRARGDKS